MRVDILGNILDVPDVYDPSDLENQNKFLELKRLVELEFDHHFGKKIEINNWEYIYSRASAYKVPDQD